MKDGGSAPARAGAALSSPRSRSFTLADGRRLAYAEFGAADGRPLFFFPPMPGSRLYGQQLDAAARELGVRVIAPDPPGIGCSDYREKRVIADTAGDIDQVAAGLGLARFDVVGAAGGAAHALACAWRCGAAIDRVALVNPALPLNTRAIEDSPGIVQQVLFWAVRTPWANRVVMGLVARAAKRSPGVILKQVERWSSESDMEILSRPDVRELIVAAAADAFQHGARGAALEMALLSGYWDIDFREIGVAIDVWQAEDDPQNCPDALNWLTKRIPHCNVTLVPGAGQLWLIDHADTVLRALARPSDDLGRSHGDP